MYYTYKNFNFYDVASSFNNVKKLYLSLYFFIFIPLIYTLSYKFILLIKNYKIINQKESIKINLISSFYNIFLPAKLGDVTRIFYSKIKKKNYFECISLTFYEKVISMISILLIISFFSGLNTKYTLGVILLTLFFLILSFNFNVLINFINYIIINFNIKKISLTKKSSKTIKENFYIFFLIDTFVWLLIFLQIFFISKGLGLDLTYTEISCIFGLSIVIGTIPVSFGGFGIRDVLIFESLKDSIDYNNILTLLIFFNLRYLIPGIIGYIIKISEYRNR